MLPSLLALWFGVVQGAAPRADPGRASPETWAALQQELPKDKVRRVASLLRFASDDAAAAPDRVRASRSARVLMLADDPRRLATWLLEVEIQGALEKPAARARALAGARAAARGLQQQERATRIDEARAGEDAMARLVRAAKARERSNEGPLEPAMWEPVNRALASWLALGDELQHGRARMWVARAGGLDVDGQARELADVVDALGAARLHAKVRAEALLARAQLLERHQRAWEAAADRIAVDHERAIDARQPAGAARTPSQLLYLRSRDTAAACKPLRTEKATCARMETERFGARSFYDFSTEGRASFDVARADDVLAEYESTVQDCLKQGAKDNLTTDTHVELEWGVAQDGRVKGLDVRPLRLRGTSVERCLTAAFNLWRYPRYTGEMQHVRMDFNVGTY